MPRIKLPTKSDYTIQNHDSGPIVSNSISSCLDVKNDPDGGVSIADSSDIFDFQTGGSDVPISISLWSRLATGHGGTSYLFGKYSSTTASQRGYYAYVLSNEKIGFVHFDTDGDSSGFLTAENTHTLGTWVHIVITLDLSLGSNDEKIYINGSLALQETADGDQGLGRNTTSALYIGNLQSNFSHAHEGQISNFVFYKHGAGTGALTADQVSTIYNNGVVLADPTSGPRGSDIVGWYKMATQTTQAAMVVMAPMTLARLTQHQIPH